MSVTRYEPQDAPGYAKHVDSFQRDERCYTVAYFVGQDYNEVFVDTYEAFARLDCIDYDVAYSTEGGLWVGTVVKDHDVNTKG